MKKNLIITFCTLSTSLILVFMISGFNTMQPKKPWLIPDAAKSKKNPIAANAESIADGKSLWATHCKSCHGTKGLGDGPKAGQLKTEPGDFSKSETQLQSDGSLFYKTSEGRDDMPSFKKKIPDADDIWNIINYLRGFKK